MSLTSHLKDMNSPVRAYLYETFPNVRRLTKPGLAALRDAPTIRQSATVPYLTLGTAIDYRLRYYFGVTASQDLIAWQGALHTDPLIYDADEDELLLDEPAKRFFDSLGETVERLNPVGRKLSRSDEELICRYCLVLALFEDNYRSGRRESPITRHEQVPGSDTKDLVLNPGAETAEDYLVVAEEHWVDDLCNLSWLIYDRFQARFNEPVVLNPNFDGSVDVGGADADFILDGCLVDIKATINSRIDRGWLYQLLGYVLLDYEDRFKLQSVGLYMARQGVLLRWTLSDFVSELCDGSPRLLGDLRADFRQAIS